MGVVMVAVAVVLVVVGQPWLVSGDLALGLPLHCLCTASARTWSSSTVPAIRQSGQHRAESADTFYNSTSIHIQN